MAKSSFVVLVEDSLVDSGLGAVSWGLLTPKLKVVAPASFELVGKEKPVVAEVLPGAVDALLLPKVKPLDVAGALWLAAGVKVNPELEAF